MVAQAEAQRAADAKNAEEFPGGRPVPATPQQKLRAEIASLEDDEIRLNGQLEDARLQYTANVTRTALFKLTPKYQREKDFSDRLRELELGVKQGERIITELQEKIEVVETGLAKLLPQEPRQSFRDDF